VGKPIEHKNDSEFIGDLSKFKYLAIHGYERWQVDRDGKLRDGMSSEWIKDYCRKDSDPEYMRLTMVQRYVLDGMRRLTGLHGKWCPNDAMWVARALCAAPVERKYVTYAVSVLVLCGLVTLSNERLGSLEGVEEKRSASYHSTERSGTGASGNHSSLIDSEAKSKAAPKAKPSVPKFQGKISVKPTSLPARPVPDEIKGSMSEYLANAWRYYELPGDTTELLWSQLIEDYGEDVVQVLRWAMFINKDRYWLKARINSVEDFARCFEKMHEQYLKCGGPELEKALEFADDKYCSEHQDVVTSVGEQSEFVRVCLGEGCTGRLVVEPGQTMCRECRGVTDTEMTGLEPDEDESEMSPEEFQRRLSEVEVGEMDGLD